MQCLNEPVLFPNGLNSNRESEQYKMENWCLTSVYCGLLVNKLYCSDLNFLITNKWFLSGCNTTTKCFKGMFNDVDNNFSNNNNYYDVDGGVNFT